MSTALTIRANSPQPINHVPNLPLHKQLLVAPPAVQINQLRRKRKPLSPVPRIAYTVMGHGNEMAHLPRIVPKGCILIVPTKSGDKSITSTAITHNMRVLNKNYRQIILDPLNNSNELIDLFGPVSIFTEGQQYPNFSYSLFGMYKANKKISEKTGRPISDKAKFRNSGVRRVTEETNHSEELLYQTLLRDYYVFTNQVGLAESPRAPANIRYLTLDKLSVPLLLVDGKLPDMKKIKSMSFDECKEKFKDSMTQLNPEAETIIRKLNLPGLYTYSNAFDDRFTTEWLNEIIEKDLKNFKVVRPRPAWVSTDVETYITDDIRYENMRITQEELFEKGGPGVYYNFICRSLVDQDGLPLDDDVLPGKLSEKNMRRIGEAEASKFLIRQKFSGARRKYNRRRSTLKRFNVPIR